MGKGMRAGKRPKTGGGGKRGQMAQIQQMQAMQKQMEIMQAELDEKEITATAGGGVVTAVVTGKKELVSLTIDKDVVDPDDVETLQDLVIAAVNEGMRQVDEIQSDEYGKLTGGLDIPGL
jgi:DNA-binding YbaB/EbfC family protein